MGLREAVQELQMSRRTSSICLEVCSGPHDGLRFPLVSSREETLGRAMDNSIRLPHDRRISARHAEIFWMHGDGYLRDRRSTNGVLIDDERITEPVSLYPGLSFQLGETRIRVREESDGFLWMSSDSLW